MNAPNEFRDFVRDLLGVCSRRPHSSQGWAACALIREIEDLGCKARDKLDADLATLRASGRLAPAVEGDVDCHGLDTPERVCFYEHDFYPLSNFSSFQVEWSGFTFATSEHLYHWLKFSTGEPADLSIARAIANAPSAHEAFKIAEANKASRRADWDEVKVPFMRRIIRAKVDQHEYVRRKLLATGDRELVENSWRDDFWGWGPNRDGQNMLGRLWMELRAELRTGATR